MSRDLGEFLKRHARIGLDTNIFIYLLTQNPRYVGLASQVFDWVEQPRSEAVTSTLTLTELLVTPYRAGDRSTVEVLYALLTTYPNVRWAPTTLEIADRAAEIRGLYGLRTPDAVQVATAVLEGCTGFVSNDSVFHRIPDIETINFDELLRNSGTTDSTAGSQGR